MTDGVKVNPKHLYLYTFPPLIYWKKSGSTTRYKVSLRS